MATELRLIIVTPEKTLLDQPVSSVSVPLFDGQMGILPGRAPIVGRLGAGSLRFTDGNTESVFFVDGGFLQVKGPVVSVLTNRSMTLAEIDVDAARASLTEALSQRPTTDEDFETRDRELDRARKMVALARKPR